VYDLVRGEAMRADRGIVWVIVIAGAVVVLSLIFVPGWIGAVIALVAIVAGMVAASRL
jgi:hypothetical protein